MSASEHSLATTARGNIIVVTRDRDGYAVHGAPRWLLEAFAVEGDFPLAVDTAHAAGHPFSWVFNIVDEVVAGRARSGDYFREVEAANGERLALFVHAGYRPGILGEGDGSEVADGVLLAVRDVSALVRDRRRAAAVGAFHGLVGQSIPMLEVYHRISMYGPTDAPVIITGETGTGKELVARALHDRSPRAEKSFVAVNCAALSVELFESELFGHEKGSFTGAIRQHRGRFERADGGTLFLDEIGEMPLMTQSKLLRALEEGIIERVGGEREQRVDVRLVAATNVPLEHSVTMRTFRADLYHRLSVLRIHLPPLRERRGDVALLVEHWLEIFNRRYNKAVKRLTPEAIKILEDYSWPGNVRELRNVVERLVVETQGEAVGANALVRWVEEREYLIPGEWNADAMFAPRRPIVPEPWDADAARGGLGQAAGSGMPSLPLSWPGPPSGRRSEPPPLPGKQEYLEVLPLRVDIEPKDEPAELTKEAIVEAHRKAKGNLTRAASALGVHKATLYRHMKKLGLSRESLEAGYSDQR